MNHSYDKTRFENNKILYDYMEERLGGINEELDGQLNAFRAYWLIMAVFHEIKSGNKMLPAANHIRKKIAETQMLSYILAFNTFLQIHRLDAWKLLSFLIERLDERFDFFDRLADLQLFAFFDPCRFDHCLLCLLDAF